MDSRIRRIACALLVIGGLAAGGCSAARGQTSTRPEEKDPTANKADAGKAKDEKPTAKSDEPAKPKKPQKHRWELLSDHVYKWVHERRAVGTTSFHITREKPGAPGAFKANVKFSYENEGTSITSQRQYSLDANWRLVSFEVETGVRTIKNVSAVVEASARRNGNELITTTVMNGDRDRSSETRLDYARDAYVLWPQSVELWALYSPTLLPVDETKTIRVLYPYFAKTYKVTITPKGDVEFRLGTETIPCRRYRFRSDDRQLDGEIWADATGRMLAYKQGKLTISLEPGKADETK